MTIESAAVDLAAVASANPRFFAIIPAAGYSRRMGAPKLLLPFRNATVIDHKIIFLLFIYFICQLFQIVKSSILALIVTECIVYYCIVLAL